MTIRFARSARRLRSDSHAGTNRTPAMNTGPRTQPRMKARVFTRSRYSRRMTAHSLALTTHALLDALRADRLEEDLVQRWLHELETCNRCAGRHESLEQSLRRRVVCELQLEELILIVDASHERRVREHRGDATRDVATQRERDVSLAVRALHGGDGAVEHLFAMRDDAHRVAESLGVVHEVGREDHRLPAFAELDDRVLERLCVDRI